MTGNSDKMRALILSALMVLSVFAGTIALSGAATAQAGNANLVGAIEYDDEGDGEGGDIELEFNEVPSNINSVTVYVNDQEIGSADTVTPASSVVVTDAQYGGDDDLTPNNEVIVNVDYGSGENENRTVQVTSKNIDLTGTPAGSTAAVYVGEPVAVQTSDDDVEFDIEEDGTWVNTRGTGDNSDVFAYDTTGVDAGTNVTLRETSESGGNTANLQYLEMRDLGLDVTADSNNVTTNDNVTGTVSAGAPGRSVDLTLFDSDGDEVDSESDVTLGGGGESAFDFGADLGAGTYTVQAQDVDTGNSVETDDINVEEVTGSVDFTSTVVTEERGDIVRADVTFTGGADEANVTLGDSEDVSYELNFQITDDGDGEATIVWNTADSHNNESAISVDGASKGTVNIVDNVSSPVHTGEYGLSLDHDNGESVATVIIEERSTTDLTSHTAPETDTDLEDIQDTISSDEVGNTIATTSTQSDAVILQLEASGLSGIVDDETDFTSNGLDFTVSQDEESVRINDDAITMAADDGDVEMVPDSANDTYYLVFSASALTDAGAEVGDTFTAEFSVTAEDNDLTDEDQSATASFELVEGDVQFDLDNEMLFVPATENAAVTGTSTWAPGSSVDVLLRSTGGTNPFSKQNQSGVVQPDGTWSVTFDMTDAAEGQDITLARATARGGSHEVEGAVGELSASVSFSDQQAADAGTRVTVDSATLNQGGFIAIHQESASGPIVGESDYLEAGSHSDVNIRLDEAIDGQTTLVAMAHKDTDGNQQWGYEASDGDVDGPYQQGGSAVTSPATVSIQTPTPEDTPTDTPTDTPDETPTDTPTDTPDETPSPTPTDTPGFGLALALLALAGAALLALRRD